MTGRHGPKPATRIFDGPFDWVQDAVVMDGTMLVLDVNHTRIAAVDIPSAKVLYDVRHPSEWKGFQLEFVPPAWTDILAACEAQQAGNGCACLV
jgi:hypothetical protein